MYIQRRTVEYWANLTKSLRDEAHLPAGLHFSRLKVPALQRCEKFASKQMRFASAITLNDDRP
ncbi:hypothetical protein MNBD_ALPHA08-87 [hydrothermal vent metagenome]|uniref:Uncharacterized protein n=1 Tax=hydrothermal vent metagenome TaxID=652676 RepID=A0A3B0S088_9ZZZZ